MAVNEATQEYAKFPSSNEASGLLTKKYTVHLTARHLWFPSSNEASGLLTRIPQHGDYPEMGFRPLTRQVVY